MKQKLLLVSEQDRCNFIDKICFKNVIYMRDRIYYVKTIQKCFFDIILPYLILVRGAVLDACLKIS